MLEHARNPVERAHLTACALGIHLNIAHESYGGTESIRVMVDDEIIFHGTVSQAVAFMCSLHSKVSRLLALFSADKVDHQDKSSCYHSISGTVAPKVLAELYDRWIFGNSDLVRYLGAIA